MPVRSSSTYVNTPFLNFGCEMEHVNMVWYHSKKGASGNLDLRDLQHTRMKRNTLLRVTRDVNGDAVIGLGAIDPRQSLASLEAESYARLRGKLYKGSSSLGVTAASWQQSRQMISESYGSLTRYTTSRFARIERRLRARGGFTAREIANEHLKFIFGWVPLYSDIHAAATSVIQNAVPITRVTARSEADFPISFHQNRGNAVFVRQGMMRGRVTRSATVRINNPNMWLAERAGTLNPATVAWDLVPWSFAVNFFVNINQLVQSITDFAGLEFPSSSTTRAYKSNYAENLTPTSGSTVKPAFGNFSADYKFRTLDGVARPPLTLKLPEVNWETAAMAASLFTQRLGTIRRLLG